MIDWFPTESNFQGYLFKEFLFEFVSFINASKNFSPNKCNEYSYLWLHSLIQSSCPGVLTGKFYIGVGTNI